MNQPESAEKPKGILDRQANSLFSTPNLTITKRALYKHLADKYYIPPRDSKGVSRLYLERVDKGACFRVELIQMKRFLAELTPSQTKRSLHSNKAEAYLKLTSILRELNLQPLGFDAQYMPDSEWLFNVLRYVDAINASGIFESELTPNSNVGCDSAVLLKAKKNAEQLEFTDTGFLKNKKNYDAIQNLAELQRRLVSRKAEVKMIMRDLESKNNNIQKDEQEINRELISIALGGRSKADNFTDIGKEELGLLSKRVEA